MATIVNNPKYGDGHQVILKEKITSNIILQKFRENKYVAGKSIFSIIRNNIPSDVKKYKTINLTGKDQIFLKDDKGVIVRIVGSSSTINGAFNHFSGNAKSNTGLLTEIKELVSMYVFQSLIETNAFPNEDDVVAKLNKNMVNLYDSTYYSSAVAQAKELKKYLRANKGYTYERQTKDRSNEIYIKARKLTGKLNDNWNPADIWMFKKGLDLTNIYQSTSYKELNSLIAQGIKDKDILPISLKQVSKPYASLNIVDPNKLTKEKLDLDLSPDKIDLSETFNNFIVWTKSGYGVRAGFKASSTTINVSLEGRFKGAGYQVGAVDAKEFASYVAKEDRALEVGPSTVSDIERSKAKLKMMFVGNPIKISSKFPNYEAAIRVVDGGDQLTKDRFFNLMSYMNAFYKIDFKEILKFCYYSSKKISNVSSTYIIIQ